MKQFDESSEQEHSARDSAFDSTEIPDLEDCGIDTVEPSVFEATGDGFEVEGEEESDEPSLMADISIDDGDSAPESAEADEPRSVADSSEIGDVAYEDPVDKPSEDSEDDEAGEANDSEADELESGGNIDNLEGDEIPPEEDDEVAGDGSDAEDEPGAVAASGDRLTVEQTEVRGNLTMAKEVKNFYNELSSDDRDAFLRVACEEWVRLDRLFVPSQSCDSFSTEGLERRFLVVVGKEHAGKRATALHLASRLAYLSTEHSGVVIYRPAASHRQISLHDLLNRKDSPTNSLFLVEDVFDFGISPIEIKSLGSLETQLREQDSFLILTTELSVDDLPADVARLACSAQLNSDELLKLLNRALEQGELGESVANFREVRKWLHALWDRLSPILDSPFKIERFYRRLLDRAADSNVLCKDDVFMLAQQAADPGPWFLRKWFQELLPNERLLAFLIVFFPDLDRSDLVHLYCAAVEWLRDTNRSLFDDPRTIGLEDMLHRIQASTRNGLVHVEGTHYQREILAQAANHEILLRSLVEIFLARFKGVRGESSWQLRKGLGTLLGFLGARDWKWLEGYLDPLADDKSWQLRTIASYAIGPIIALDLEQRTLQTLEVLGRWCQTANSNYWWTVGSALWQAYLQLMAEGLSTRRAAHAQVMKHEVMLMLRVLMGRDDWSRWVKARLRLKKLPRISYDSWQILKQCSLFPLRHVVRADAVEVAPTLARWMTEGEEPRNLSIAAMQHALIAPSRRNLGALPALVGGLLQSTAATGLRCFHVFRALAAWLRREDLRQGLLQALLEVAHRGSARQRYRLALALAWAWYETDLEYEGAGRLIARLAALEGLGGPRPEGIQGLLVLDPATFGDESHDRVRRLIEHLMGSRLDLRIGWLGSSESWRAEDEALDFGLDPSLAAERPRLLVPLLESCGDPLPSVTVIMSGDRILDFEDLKELHPRGSLMFFDCDAFGSDEAAAVEAMADVRIVRLPDLRSESLSPAIMRSIDESLRHFSEEADQADVSTATGRTISLDSPAAEIETRLLDVVPEMAEFSAENGRGDFVGQFSALFSGWFERDAEGASQVLCRWMEQGQAAEDLKSSSEAPVSAESRHLASLGVACSKKLIRDSVRRSRRCGGSTWKRIFDPLALHLVATDATSHELVLEALEEWLQQPSWCEYLTASSRDGESPLSALVASLAPGHAARAERIVESVAASFPEIFGTAPAVGRLPTFDAASISLPELAPGQDHGLVFVDPAAGGKVAEAAFQIARLWQSDEGEREIVPSLFELGCSRPFWIPGLFEQRRRPSHGRPMTLLPALETLSSPSRAHRVLVLSSGIVLDRGELETIPWQTRVSFADLSPLLGQNSMMPEEFAALTVQMLNLS